MALNKNGTITLCGIEFDLPKKSDLRKWDYKEWKESRSVFKEIWLNHYNYNTDGSVSLSQYKLTSKNGSVFSLDDKRLKDEKDIENAQLVFKSMDEDI